MKALHAINQLRVPLIRDGLITTGSVQLDNVNKSSVLNGIKILEVGCGAGILTEALAKLRASVVALDPSEKLLDAARAHMGDEKKFDVQYICATVEEHSEENRDKYDAVVASEVLEHVPDQISFLKECVNCLKPGGSIFVTTMNKTQASWLGGIVAAEYVLNLVPKGTHDFDKFISPTDVSKILSELNCSTILVHGFRYEFWRNVAKWQKYDGINYALHAVKNAS
jgi:polyprenyldihydroxybenzoate methyltransferase/3-demethylubiquinol 3-O-methyltransferase